MAFPDAASRIVDPFTPKCELHVTWGSVSLKEGDKMTPTVVQGLPKIKFDGQEGKLYCIAFTDPDAPNPTEPKFAEFNHWLTVNVPAPKADGPVEYGDPIVAYVGSAPGQAGGVHRYVFVVYEQPDKLTCDEPRVPIQRCGSLSMSDVQLCVVISCAVDSRPGVALTPALSLPSTD
jgi:hypothetical protein